MSFNVLVITEDYVQDEHVVGPLVEKMFQHLGKKARVLVCRNPRFRGVKECTNFELVKEKVIKAYPMVNLFLLLIDRDAEPNRRQSLTDLEDRIKEHLKSNQTFLTEHAFQEVEVWAIAGQDLPSNWSWQEIRAERDSKERFYVPLAQEKGILNFPHQGRKQMTLDSLKNWSRMLQRCPEDIGRLTERVSSSIS